MCTAAGEGGGVGVGSTLNVQTASPDDCAEAEGAGGGAGAKPPIAPTLTPRVILRTERCTFLPPIPAPGPARYEVKRPRSAVNAIFTQCTPRVECTGAPVAIRTEPAALRVPWVT